MRPFVIGATAYLVTLNFLFVLTRGAYHSPDRWADLYLAILATYAGGTEVRRWINKSEPADPNSWGERLHKGGPLITLWLLLVFGIGLWRIADSTRPMPPELQDITLKVLGIFFGAYALRQYRRRGRSALDSRSAPGENADGPDQEVILSSLRDRGSQNTRALETSTGIPRRSLLRLLKTLTADGRVKRIGESPTDPRATYSLTPIP